MKVLSQLHFSAKLLCSPIPSPYFIEPLIYFTGKLAQERHEEKKKLILSDDDERDKDSQDEEDEEEGEAEKWGRMSHISLLDQHSELKKMAEAKKLSAKEKQLREEEKILRSVQETKALMGVAELAKGRQFVSSSFNVMLIVHLLTY